MKISQILNKDKCKNKNILLLKKETDYTKKNNKFFNKCFFSNDKQLDLKKNNIKGNTNFIFSKETKKIKLSNNNNKKEHYSLFLLKKTKSQFLYTNTSKKSITFNFIFLIKDTYFPNKSLNESKYTTSGMFKVLKKSSITSSYNFYLQCDGKRIYTSDGLKYIIKVEKKYKYIIRPFLNDENYSKNLYNILSKHKYELYVFKYGTSQQYALLCDVEKGKCAEINLSRIHAFAGTPVKVHIEHLFFDKKINDDIQWGKALFLKSGEKIKLTKIGTYLITNNINNHEKIDYSTQIIMNRIIFFVNALNIYEKIKLIKDKDEQNFYLKQYKNILNNVFGLDIQNDKIIHIDKRKFDEAMKKVLDGKINNLINKSLYNSNKYFIKTIVTIKSIEKNICIK